MPRWQLRRTKELCCHSYLRIVNFISCSLELDLSISWKVNFLYHNGKFRQTEKSTERQTDGQLDKSNRPPINSLLSNMNSSPYFVPYHITLKETTNVKQAKSSKSPLRFTYLLKIYNIQLEQGRSSHMNTCLALMNLSVVCFSDYCTFYLTFLIVTIPKHNMMEFQQWIGSVEYLCNMHYMISTWKVMHCIFWQKWFKRSILWLMFEAKAV